MNIIITLYALLLGSFYNVVGLRVAAKQSIVKPRSACPGCGRTLGPLELIPVVSYVWQRGKCRGCGSRISPLYPIMEAMTAVLFVFAYITLGLTAETVIAWTLISLFIIITVSDVTYMLIPDKVLLFFGCLFAVERLLFPLTPWWDSLLGAALGFGLLLLIAVISKGGMGGGDIKLYAVLGLALGTKVVLLSFFLSSLFGAIGGVAAVALKILPKGKPIPFGPFIGAGTLIAFFYHQPIIDWYFSFLQ